MAVAHGFLFFALYAEVYLLLSFLESKDAPEEVIVPESLPTVAIIVPCFNEASTVEKTVASLLALSYPTEKLSIIVVNDGSTDGTLAAVTPFAHHPQVTILSKENGGKYTAMNMALAHTTAAIVGCLDADSFVEPTSLTNAVTTMIAENADAVTPSMMIGNPHGVLGLVQQAEYTLSLFMRKAFAAARAVLVTPGPFSLFRRDALVTLGGWRHAHGSEDLDIALRMNIAGMKIVNAHTARVLTTAPLTLRALFKQRVRWTYGFLMNAWDHRDLLFSGRVGALGIVVIPSTLVAILGSLFFSGLMIFGFTQYVYAFAVRVDASGGIPPIHTPDPFFFNTTSLALIIYLLFAVTLGLLFIGKSLGQTRLRPLAIPAYLFLYSILAPWWLGTAVVRAAARAQAPWR